MWPPNVTERDHACPNDARDFIGLPIIWSVSNVPPTPATEEAMVDCVVFFTGTGKAARIFERKTRLDKKWKGQREKPVEAKRYQKIRRLPDKSLTFTNWSLASKIKIVTIQ